MNKLDSQLDELASSFRAGQTPVFPSVLEASLRRRRVSRRVRFGAVVLCPILSISAFLWWPRSSTPQFDTAPGIFKTVARADLATLPAGQAWQPASIERACDRLNPDLSGF